MENRRSGSEGGQDDPSVFPYPTSEMDEQARPQEEKFFRPKRRREPRGGERFQRILRKTIRITSALLLISCLLFLGDRVYVYLLENPSFRVRKIEVKGSQKIAQESLLSLASIEGMPNLFTLRLKDVAKRLEAHPWIERVTIRKAFPNKVEIEVEERRPIAIVQLDDLYYIDRKGVIFGRAGDGDGYDYPFLTGLNRRALEKDSEESKGLIAKALEVLLALEQERGAPLKEVSEVHVDKISGMYCISKADGLEVKMGWDDFREKVKRLNLVWTDLGSRGITVSSVDCSDVNRIVVKKASKEAPEASRAVVKRASRGGSRFTRR
jgi:cell division protein FtsQ